MQSFAGERMQGWYLAAEKWVRRTKGQKGHQFQSGECCAKCLGTSFNCDSTIKANFVKISLNAIIMVCMNVWHSVIKKFLPIEKQVNKLNPNQQYNHPIVCMY